MSQIGLIQMNSVAGDFPRNLRTIVEYYRACVDGGADIVFTPPLALPGLNSQDLVYMSRFAIQCDDALEYLTKETLDIPLCVGTYLFDEEGNIEEGYVLLKQNEIIEAIPCTDNGISEPALISTDKIHILLLPEGCDTPIETNADLVVCPSAEPWRLHSEQNTFQHLSLIAQELKTPLAYCAAVGAYDEWILNGQSFIINKHGDCLDQLAPFEEGILTLNLSTTKTQEYTILDPNEMLYKGLALSLKDYCHKTGIPSVCLGLSGGIDSALVATLAVEALGPENVTGITMPSKYSSQGSIDDSHHLAQNLGITCEEIGITPVFEEIKKSLAPIFSETKEDVTEENMQSRIRGLFLMSVANKFHKMLLSTGNKSEAAVGYCTLYGDTCGGLALIADLYKGQVYELARWINRDREIIPWNTIEKAPSAELRPGQKDQDTLPPYEILDEIIYLMVEEHLSPSDIIEQFHIDEHYVRWTQRRIALNEWKRKQGALIPQVSSKSFGSGRNFPIVQNFRD